jgi:5-methylcytosine-specific restriction endonuclease McrA
MSDIFKSCSGCKEQKPITDFYKKKSEKDGLDNFCKKCNAANRNAWVAKNKARNNEVTRLRQIRHKEERRERYKDKYKGRYKEYRRMYCQQHSAEALIRYHNSRAKRNKCEGTLTLEEWASLCDIYNHVCLMCGKPEPLTIDHIVPLSKGGSNFIQNIQPLCRSCNSSKSNKTIDFRPRKKAEEGEGT